MFFLWRIGSDVIINLNFKFFANSERTLSGYFQFAPDGFGSRFACIDSGAPHFYWFNRQKSSQTVNLPALLFFHKKLDIQANY